MMKRFLSVSRWKLMTPFYKKQIVRINEISQSPKKRGRLLRSIEMTSLRLNWGGRGNANAKRSHSLSPILPQAICHLEGACD